MKIGLDIGGSHIAIGAIKEDCTLLFKTEKDIKISESKNPEKTLFDNMVLLIEDIICKMETEKIELIGISAPRKYKGWKNYCCRKFKYKKYGNSKTIGK